MNENRFGLILQMVAQRDSPRTAPAGNAIQEIIPHATAQVLHRPLGRRKEARDIGPPAFQRQLHLLRTPADEFLIPVRFLATQPMIEMRKHQTQVQLSPQMIENLEERHRIRTSG